LLKIIRETYTLLCARNWVILITMIETRYGVLQVACESETI